MGILRMETGRAKADSRKDAAVSSLRRPSDGTVRVDLKLRTTPVMGTNGENAIRD
jgi:hypothetical protein